MFRLKCNHCETIFETEINPEEQDFGVVESTERQMGRETHYSSQYYIECPHCKQTGILVIDCWEYPEGSYNYCEIHIEDGYFERIEGDCFFVCNEMIQKKA